MSRPFYNDIDAYVRQLIMEQMGVGTAEGPQTAEDGGKPTPAEAPEARRETTGPDARPEKP